MQRRYVDTIITHLHLDELGALYVLMQFGQEKFVITPGLQLDFRSRPERRTPDYWARQRKLVIGGSGDILDEHLDGDTHRSRIEGQSATRLATEFCEVTDPHMSTIAVEINTFDNGAGCPSTHLATILKIVGTHTEIPEKLEAIGSMTLRIISAIHWSLAFKLATPSISFLDYAMGIVRSSVHWDDEDAVHALVAMLEKESVSKGTLFGLRNIYDSLCAVTVAYPKQFDGFGVNSVMTDLIEMLYIGQVDFHTIRRSVLAMKLEKLILRVIQPYTKSFVQKVQH
jgi:hypothetical protein